MTSIRSRARVLICIPCLGLGGAEDIIVRLANGLSITDDVQLRALIRCNEDQSRVAALHASVDFSALVGGMRRQNSINFTIWTLCFYAFAPFLAVYLFFRYSVRQRDTVHVNLTQFALYSIFWRMLSIGRRPQFIQTFHTNMHLLKKWQRAIFSTSWKFMDKVVVEIDEREILNVQRYIAAEKITFIPFAVALEKHFESKTAHANAEVITFGSLARLRLFEKKYDSILRGLALLKERGIPFRYLVGGDGPDINEISALIKSLGLEQEVELLGAIVDRRHFFSRIDALIVATVGYDSGIAGLQALAAGVPLIGFNTKSDFIVDGKNKLMTVSTSADLAEKLQELSDVDLQLYWAALCDERSAQLGDEKMIGSYSAIFGSYRLRPRGYVSDLLRCLRSSERKR